MADSDRLAQLSDLLRHGDKDRFLCDLFVPPERRPDVMAVHAFGLEVARVRELVSEPMPGEIRLQWWRDALGGEGHGEVSRHPVGGALLEAVARHDLPRKPLLDLIEARSFDLYQDPMGSLAELEGYAAATAGPMFGHAARILGGRAAADERIAVSGGIAYAVAGLLRAVPHHAARGQLYVPLELIDRHGGDPAAVFGGRADAGFRVAVEELANLARSHLDIALQGARAAEPAVLPALLPLALVPAHLARLRAAGHDPFALRALPQWRRQWIIWRAARRGLS